MLSLFRRDQRKPPPAAVGPVLDLSGPRLRRAFENLVASGEQTGGIERYVGALALKASLFQEVLGKGRVADMTEGEFLDLAAFVTPARRRIAASLGESAFLSLRPDRQGCDGFFAAILRRRR